MKGKSGRVKDSMTSSQYIQRLILKATKNQCESLKKIGILKTGPQFIRAYKFVV